jgi:hypothetical protein
VKRRVFLAGFATQLVGREISRNKLWREFVPMVKDSSVRLVALQDYMVEHQHEKTLATVDRTFLSNLDCCIDGLQQMTHKLKLLKQLIENGG